MFVDVAASKLKNELKMRFPDHVLLDAMGIIYP